MFEQSTPLRKENHYYDIIFLGISASIALPFYISSALMVISLLYLLVRERRHLKDIILQMGYLGLFILFATLTGISKLNIVGIAAALAMWIFVLLISFYYQSITAQRYQRIIHIFIMTSLIPIGVALWSYYKYLHTYHLHWLYIVQDATPSYRADATFFNANYYGFYCILIILLCIYQINRHQSLKIRAGYLLIGVLNFVGIIMTASRMVYPALIIGVVCLLVFIDKRFGLATLLIGSFGLAVLIVKPSLFPRFGSLAYAFEDRVMIWQTGWSIFEYSPLTGFGPLSYLRYYYLFQGKATLHSHNLYIDSLASYGIYGVFIFFLGTINYIRRLINQFQLRESLPELGLIVSFIAVTLVHGLTDVSIFWMQTAFIFSMIVVVPISLLKEFND